MDTNKQLTERTIKIIEAHGRILLKRDDSKYLGFFSTPRYLSGWTNIAAGPDNCIWGRRNVALEFFNIKWARTIAPLYGAKVVVVYPKKDKLSQNTGVPECTGLNCPVCAEGDPDFPHKTAAPIHVASTDRKTVKQTIGQLMKTKYGLTDMPAKKRKK